jgi:hypothetical protein
MIAMDLEPDNDAEPQGDEEPSLGSIDNATNQDKWAPSGSYSEYDLDREAEHDGREPDDEPEDGGDDEPSLGASEPVELDPHQGSYWGSKFYLPTEKDQAQVYNQAHWSHGQGDLEEEHDGKEPDDTGIGDSGGLAEQCGGLPGAGGVV